MKKILALGAVAMLAIASGCGNKKPATASAPLAPAPPPPPVMPVTPVVQEKTPVTAVTADPAPLAETFAPAGGRTYVVRRGDTLWGIATRTYGDGKQYRKIVAANPSIRGDRVLAGQTIVLP